MDESIALTRSEKLVADQSPWTVCWWLDNVLKPAANTALLEPYNSFTHLAAPGFESKLFEVKKSEVLCREWFAQNISTGVAMTLPYGLAALCTRAGLRRLAPGNAFLDSRHTATIIGAGLYDFSRVPKQGETRLGNAAAGVLAFSTFEAGNHLSRNLKPIAFIGTRALVGMTGATVHITASSLISRGEVPRRAEYYEAWASGATMNLVLPKTLSIAQEKLGWSKPDEKALDGITDRRSCPTETGEISKYSLLEAGRTAAIKVDMVRRVANVTADTAGIEPESQPLTSMTEHGRKLGIPGEATDYLPRLATDDVSQFKSRDDFASNGLEFDARKVRVYQTTNGVRIVLPEDYAARLDKVAEFRRALELDPTADADALARTILKEDIGLRDRVLPEDIVAQLEALPAPEKIRKVILLDEANPEDPWIRHDSKIADFTSAATASPDGVLTLFKRDRDNFLTVDLRHEVAHLLLPSDASDPLARAWDHAVELDPNGTMQRPYARYNSKENWAIHLGEIVLGPDSSQARAFATNNPIRSMVFAKALRETLSQVPERHRQFVLHRIATLECELPAAKQKLRTMMSDTAAPESANTAARLLIHFGDAADFRGLNITSLDLSGEPISDAQIAHLSSLAPTLKELNLSNVLMSKEGTLALQLPELVKLDLSGNYLLNSSMSGLLHLGRLRFLNISNTRVGDGGLLNVGGLSSLKLINAGGSEITSYGVSSLRGLRSDIKVLGVPEK